jgi:hypothetical protein
VSKLRGAGFYTVESVAVTPVRELIDRVGLGVEVAEKVLDAARDLVSDGFISSYDLYPTKKTALRLMTGIAFPSVICIEKRY